MESVKNRDTMKDGSDQWQHDNPVSILCPLQCIKGHKKEL